ncbi:Predicted ATP-dependent endonuclease of the OLD family, contains P-loop ATPase and TOPRIM domains [Thiothrix caldifontis]|uniref:Predicted ATP-dependent endonuclease of the OLD family, contains P-loop ATPase and TOPRIM domains n=1 Tax=Thiothrix caldifontis TaxID=525918 RepID=A0A1H4FRP5_9GAMM|nr:AAA family ATPase [Thiothrix caldifontis]SEB00019.1 Predicted ATP-dependent endonuclease of the OLD family, contains P-loop ATPase and TOPRIM domains [Thiothrix caldifontis]
MQNQIVAKHKAMKIDFIEIKNFRKLQSCRIDFDREKTLLVGANNSGKTSAMIALRKFFLSPKSIDIRDISIQNWSGIDRIGADWEKRDNPQHNLNDFLPLLDVWLDVPLVKIHHVVHIIPSIDWSGGAIGVRLQFEVSDIDLLKADYLKKRLAAKKIEDEAPDEQKPSIEPKNLVEFLENSLSKYLTLKAYSLDPTQLVTPDNKGRACVQSLSEDALEIEGSPFKSLINIREIPAMRDFSSGSSASLDSDDVKPDRLIRTLSDHVRSYYDKHVEPTDEINGDDIRAFSALQLAEKAFDRRLKTGFSSVFEELTDLGIPGINNPNIVINTKFKSLDGLNHGSAVQYRVYEPEDGQEERYLPESCAGLGYQNLIAMAFLLMRFRQDWIEPKGGSEVDIKIAPLQLVMIEEPEAHLHAQVQQVFIKKAYDILRKHPDLGESSTYSTQLLVSTHSSHVAHEVDFANLRYFRRIPSEAQCHSPTSTIINLSNVFGKDLETMRFVKRYIKATDCDLFFADGAIFVEGQAERILVPHFIRHHFPNLWRRYISLIDLGGNNAPRFKPLIKALGLTSLVITDLDAGMKTQKKDGETRVVTRKAKPKVGCGQVTTNPTLTKWHPALTDIDALLSLKESEHQMHTENEYDLYIAYQKPVTDPTNKDSNIKLIPRTFEDALIYANFDALKDISGSSTTNKISALVRDKLLGDELEAELFEIIDKAEKAAFAIDCLVEIKDGSTLSPPPYIEAGLKWLEEKLEETTLLAMNSGAEGNG